MLPIAEEAAPAWVPALASAVPAAIMIMVLTWGLRLRRRAGAARRARKRRAPTSSPTDLQGLLAGLAADEATWGDLLVAGGSAGIVAARGAIDGTIGRWVYDLWLCEWIARSFSYERLPPQRIGPAWRVPYGLGRSLEPEPR